MAAVHAMMSQHWIPTLLLVFISQHTSLMTSADDAPPTMEKSEIHINIIEDRTAILPCMVKTITPALASKYKVRWYNPQNRMISYNTNIIVNDRRFSILQPFPADWNLRISRVRGRDAGKYVCRLEPEPVQEKTVYLYVQVPPSISSSDDVTISEGRNMQIFCNVSGKPQPTLTWYKDGKLIPEAKEEVLVIENISRYMSGKFECLAQNGVSPNVSRSISVTVQFRPHVSVYSKRLGQYRYKQVILICQVIDSPPGKITWYKDGRPLKQDWKYEVEKVSSDSESPRYLRIKIRQLQSEDFGEYTCVAQNTVGYDEASMTVYELLTTPTDASRGKDITTPPVQYGTTQGVISRGSGNKVGNSQPSSETGFTGKTGKQGQVVTDKSPPRGKNRSPTVFGAYTDKCFTYITVLLCLQTLRYLHIT